MGAFRVRDVTDEVLEHQREYLEEQVERNSGSVFEDMLAAVETEQAFRLNPTYETDINRARAWRAYLEASARAWRPEPATRSGWATRPDEDVHYSWEGVT